MKDEQKTREQLIQELTKLRRQNARLETSETVRRQAEEKKQHLNTVLRAIRDVSQLVAREKDRQRLLQGACNRLSETEGYHNIWIALLDESRKLITAAEAGLGDDFRHLVEQMKRGELNDFWERVLSRPGVLEIDDPASVFANRPLAEKYRGQRAMAVRLEYGEKIYGLMVASIRGDLAIDEEEQGLFEEAAGDVAFAVHSIRQEQERSRVEEALRLEQSRLEAMLDLNQRTETALRASETRLRQIIDLVPHMIFAKDRQGRFLLANRATAEAYQMSVEELVGKRHADVHPDQQQVRQMLEADRAVIESRQPKTIPEQSFVDTSGNLHFLQTIKIPYTAPGTSEPAVLGVAVDITELKRVEDELRKTHEELEIRVQKRTVELAGANEKLKREIAERKQAEEDLAYERFLLSTLMDYSPDYIYFKDTESRFIRISKALAHYFSLGDPAEAIGKSDFDIFDYQRAAQYLADEREVMRTGKPAANKEEEQNWPDGRVTWVSTSKVPLRSAEGEIVGTFGISRDITARKRVEVQLQATKEAAEAASRAKSDFLANMSHEIRTPLNAIIGMSELLLDTELDPSQREYLRMVLESSDSLLSLINDVLDFSKIEAGKLDLDLLVFDLHETLGDTMKSLAFRAHGKNLELACHIRPDVPAMLLGDPARLRQIIVNLVGNAIKFTDRGEVVVDVRCESASDDEAALHFAVSDTGIGIPEEKRQAIFAAFEQVDSSTTRRFGGTGLGLAISSRLVECMNGRIWVESQVGGGSTFHFTARFGRAREEEAHARRLRPAVVSGTRVLVVDDNATNRQILQELLSNWDMKPTPVDGAYEALRLLREGYRSGQPFDLVLTDANMPQMDGFALTEKIRQDAELGSTVIMMLTSGDRPSDIAKCERLGIAAYLLKPIKQSELFDAVVMALGISAVEDEDSEAVRPARPRWLRPLRILLAEDSLVNQRLAVALLEREGHTVVVANDGKETLAVLEFQDFDLVLMDVQMPEMDGLEATATIRAREKQSGAHVPIIAMTAHTMKGDRERCLEAGMDDYVAKPIRAGRLFDTIQNLLGTPGDSEARPQDLPDTEEAWDLATALHAVKEDHQLLKTVIETFLVESPKLMEAIRRAIAESNAAGLQFAAHSFKGSVRFFGADRAFELVCELEKMGHEASLQNAPATLAALEEEIAQLTPSLSSYVHGKDV